MLVRSAYKGHGLCALFLWLNNDWSRWNARAKRYVISANLILLLLTGLTGCVSLGSDNPSVSFAPLTPTQVQQNHLRLQKLTAWQLRGALAIHTPKHQASLFAHLQQDGPRRFDLHLFGPLGAGSIQINSNAKQTTLTQSDGKVFHAKDPEQLLATRLGWRLPLHDLYYWVRGLPTPNLKVHITNNFLHLPDRFVQQAWQIQYRSYQQVGDYYLPKRLDIRNTEYDLSLRIAINHWKIPTRLK